MADSKVDQLPHNRPLFLRDSDIPGTSLISLKLTRPENYALWSRAMNVALLVKNKLGDESRPYADHLERQRLLQFLMGLNESYSQIRSNILQRRPVLIVNQAYSAALQEESQIALRVVETNKDP
ncbi:uncharacterized protein LOC142170389 [Nicotiana tabacum]|uniref:Uncharacterized protein LOC142170389 n=1 Tax=Nicotiana tabacum TaxID=4097 RepID=A0AC58STU1_TOBAC